MILTLVSQWVLQFPIAYVLSKHTGLAQRGIWWSIPVSYAIISVITLAVYAKGDWKRKRLTEPDAELTERVSAEVLVEEGVR